MYSKLGASVKTERRYYILSICVHFSFSELTV